MQDLEFKCFTSSYANISNILTNSVGVLNPITNPNSSPRQLEYQAIWDTGATNSVISQRIIDEQHLIPVSMKKVQTAAGVTDAPTYVVDFFLPNHVAFRGIEVTRGDIGDNDVLVGMDIIGSGDFAVTSYGGRTVFTYRYPTMQCIDFVASIQGYSPVTSQKIERNDPCPCGSGKKYKRCCGDK